MMQIVFLFYESITALDEVDLHEILSRVPGARGSPTRAKPALVERLKARLLERFEPA